MDWLTFFSQMTQALAWPTALVVFFCLLRNPILNLLPELNSLKWKDFELTFSKKLKEVEEKADMILPPEKISPIEDLPFPTEKGIDHNSLLAELSPRAAILEAWLPVETALQEAAPKEISLHPFHPNPRRTILRLVKEGKIDKETVAIFDDLRALRNAAAHKTDADITTSQAKEFQQLADRLERKLREL